MFEQRVVEAELMDQPGLSPHLHRQALAGLRRVNWWSGTASLVWRQVERLARERRLTSLSILDLACGGGDVALALRRRAAQAGLSVRIHGHDKSETAIDQARQSASEAGFGDLVFETSDVLEPTPFQASDAPSDPHDGAGRAFDVVYSSLFLHHLSESDGERLLRRMATLGKHLLMVDDLRRSAAGYWLAQLGCQLLSRSRIVHVDGPMSVRAAFRESEALALAARAGWRGARLERHWPQRFLLSWWRS